MATETTGSAKPRCALYGPLQKMSRMAPSPLVPSAPPTKSEVAASWLRIRARRYLLPEGTRLQRVPGTSQLPEASPAGCLLQGKPVQSQGCPSNISKSEGSRVRDLDARLCRSPASKQMSQPLGALVSLSVKWAMMQDYSMGPSWGGVPPYPAHSQPSNRGS